MAMLPSAQIIADAAATRQVTDAKGRVLTVKTLSALDKLRVFKACGADFGNQMYLGYAMLASAVTEIDGVPLPAASNERQLEHAVQTLGDAGLDAVADALQATADDAAAQVNTAKN